MGLFVLRRLGVMLLTAIALTFVVFYLTNLPPNLEKLARTEGSVRMSDQAVHDWIEQNGHSGSVFLRYGQWLGVVPGWTYTDEKGDTRGRCFQIGEDPATAPRYCGLLQGDWGYSTFFKKPVADSLGEKLAATGWLMLAVMLVMVPTSLFLGVLSGMREGSATDRTLSTFSIASTATPEYVSGVVLVALFATAATGISPILAEYGLIEPKKTLFLASATSAMDDITFWNFALPVMTIALYGIGYIARMTRASMTEVMTQQYIRTARLKGVPFHTVVMKHALRNAMIPTVTVVGLQVGVLLGGNMIVEAVFGWPGLGRLVVDAIFNRDFPLVQGAVMVYALTFIVANLVVDVLYTYLNPKIEL